MTTLYVAGILAAFLCVAYGAPLDDATPLATEDYRLPLDIKPVNYNIILKPYLLETDGTRRFTFDGEATIEIVPSVATKNIVMHSKNLQYTKREYWAKDQTTKTNLPDATPNAVTDKITYELANTLEANKPYILHFVYEGTMDDDMHGFYRSSYVDKNNNTKWIGSTQFATNHARRAFPSFDEPKFKATYDLSITRHKSMNTFANSRIKETSPSGTDYETDVYVTFPKMSTYLVAFIVSEFEQRKTDNGSFGVIARPESEYQAQTKYSFDVGQKILAELDKYMGINYYDMGVDKMHMAAIPDFSAGAMENWGLLTYRERALLFEEGSTTLSAKQAIAAVIAHEQTHMWFGDLVTCDWWSYTWLNEGFARYFQYHGTAMVEKDWELEKQFVVDQIQSVMEMDSTKVTNPMTDENTNTPADLNRMFNSISYNKGASVIRMTKHVMGEENFQKSLQEYLKTYQLQNTVPDNLFDIWEKDIYWPSEFKNYSDSYFRSFTEKVGYPVILITFADDRKSFNVTQKRFLLNEYDGSDVSLRYTVPITYTTDKTKDFTTTKPKFFFNPTFSIIRVSSTYEIDWLIVNIQGTGYYRVNYDETSWHKIHHALYENNWSEIHELNRAQIVDDLFNFARSGLIKYELALAILEYLETEINYLPWTSAFNGYSYLAVRLGTDTDYFGAHIRQLMEKAYKKLGFVETTSDSALDIYNRAKILSWSCKYGNSDCISKAKTYFQNMKTTPVPVNIRSAVYCTAMREGSETDFDTLFNKYKSETVATEQTLILNTLGCVKNTKLVEKYFNIILGEDVRRQDKSSALSGLYTENNENVSPVFKLVTDHFERVAESMGSYSAVASAISGLASRFTEESQQKDLKDFNTKNRDKFGSSASTLEAAEKTVADNLLWSSKNLGAFKQYLYKRVSNGADYRLPLDIKPVNYNIVLKPYLLETDGIRRFTFDGEATIEIVSSVATKNVVLHSKNLKYTTREYWAKDNSINKINLPEVSPNVVTDKITYELANTLEANKPYILHFVYEGTMDDDMHGFYRSSYVDKNNNTKWIGSTQFATNHARRAFPSFDEPKFKATYDLSITRHKSMNTFANSRIKETSPSGTDYETDVYVTFPKMSTYLVAFIVSEFEQRKTDNGSFGVIARPESEYQAQTKYSFDVGQKILAELDKYMGINYYDMGVDKMHMAAIPDFSAGAMENWGLLTYREPALLYEEGSTTLSAKQSIASIITHEQVHQWFGDLVTCDWWSYTWLNEGFAQYFMYTSTDKVEPYFEMEMQFPGSIVQSVMGMDSTNATNPMTDENTNTPADLSRMFNSITYSKGASVIRMTKHVMGEENFKNSLQEYLKTYQLQSTVPDNLFDIWGKDIYWPSEFKNNADSYFRSFTEQVGYPVIHITVADDRKSFKISQKRFLLKEDDGADASLLYTVPITYTTDKEKDFNTTKPKFFLDATSSERAITINNEIDWIIVNIQETGYYRVNYDETSWHKIHHALSANNWSGIHELNRAQVVDDLFNLARSGVIKYELALAVLEYLETEINYLPWTSAFNGYSFLAIRLGTDTNHFGVHIRQLIEKAYKQLGFVESTNDSALDIYNRGNILSWSCKYGNSDCISKAKTYFQNMKTIPVPVNIRSAVYCTAMREGSETDFDTLFNKYKSETVATEQILILNTLGCVNNTKLVKKYFNIILGEDVRRQDKSSALSGLYTENNENVSPVFKLVTDNFERVAESMGGYSAVASAISGLASRFTEESQQKDLKKFNTKNGDKFGNSASTLEAAEKTVADNLLWSSKNLGAFKQYLSKRVGDGDGAASLNTFTLLTLVLFAIAAMLLH